MNADQKRRALKSMREYLAYDWVQLPIAVGCANESVGFDVLDTVTPESREFVAGLILEGSLVVGSLDQDARFVAWPGSKKEHLERVMERMPLGCSVRDEYTVWFDQPDDEEPISERSAAPERAAGRGLNKPGNE